MPNELPEKSGVLVYARRWPARLHVTKTQSERNWQRFLAGETSNHSTNGETLLDMLNRAEFYGVPYQLTAVPGMGYALKKETSHVVGK